MKSNNSLLKISGSRIQLLAEAVKKIRPGLHIDVAEWKRMPSDARSRKLATLFAMHGFTENELVQIKKAVFRINIPYRLIITCLVVALIAGVSYRVYQFFELPRVYAIGNNVPVNSSANGREQVVKQLDLFGRSNSGKATGYSMILVGDGGSYYLVQNNNFLEWFMGQSEEYYVSKTSFVRNKKEYLEYVRIFQQAKELADFDQLTVEDRIAIKTCIDNSTELFNAVVEVDRNTTDMFASFIAANGSDGQRHIFLCLKKQNGQPFNVQVKCWQGVFSEYKEVVSNVGRPFGATLQWKQYPGQQFPIIYFRNVSTKEIYQSLFPPYGTFLKT